MLIQTLGLPRLALRGVAATSDTVYGRVTGVASLPESEAYAIYAVSAISHKNQTKTLGLWEAGEVPWKVAGHALLSTLQGILAMPLLSKLRYLVAEDMDDEDDDGGVRG